LRREEDEAKGNETYGFFPLSNPHSSLSKPAVNGKYLGAAKSGVGCLEVDGLDEKLEWKKLKSWNEIQWRTSRRPGGRRLVQWPACSAALRPPAPPVVNGSGEPNPFGRLGTRCPKILFAELDTHNWFFVMRGLWTTTLDRLPVCLHLMIDKGCYLLLKRYK
jgi:hypothetical protein